MRLHFFNTQIRPKHLEGSDHMGLISNMQIECLEMRTEPVRPYNPYFDFSPYPIKNLSIVLRHFE